MKKIILIIGIIIIVISAGVYFWISNNLYCDDGSANWYFDKQFISLQNSELDKHVIAKSSSCGKTTYFLPEDNFARGVTKSRFDKFLQDYNNNCNNCLVYTMRGRGQNISYYDYATGKEIQKGKATLNNEPEILASLKTNWQTTQTLIPFRPSYHNQAEDAKKIWRSPSAVQFIGKDNVLVRFEDDNNVHVAVFKFDSGRFSLLEVFKNQAEFSLSDWQNLVNKYGDNSYPVSTYTTGLIRNKQIVSFPELTKVFENIFVKNYWEQ